MLSNQKDFRCKICGLIQAEKPWGEDGKTPSFNICDCCGVEFGYQDSTPKSIIKYRDNWLSKGAKWLDEKAKPQDWSISEQLKYVVC